MRVFEDISMPLKMRAPHTGEIVYLRCCSFMKSCPQAEGES